MLYSHLLLISGNDTGYFGYYPLMFLLPLHGTVLIVLKSAIVCRRAVVQPYMISLAMVFNCIYEKKHFFGIYKVANSTIVL